MAVGLVVTLVLSACGGTTSIPESEVAAGPVTATATVEATPVEAAPVDDAPVDEAPAALASIGSAAPDIAPLGNLVTLHSDPVTQVFDANGGSLSLADGATLQVPAGSFPAATEVTIVLADLRFDRYLDAAPEGRIYQLSTVEDVELDRPLFLDVPKQSDSVVVAELTDGQWANEALTSSQTTQIEITHFSTVIHSVIDRPSCSVPENASLCLAGQEFGDWATAATSGEVGDPFIPEGLCSICPVRSDGGFAADLVDDSTEADSAEESNSSGSNSSGSNSSGSNSSGSSTPAPTPAPTPTSSSGSSSSSSCQSGYTKNTAGTCVTRNYGCNYPAIERHDAQSCMNRDLCAPASSGYQVAENYRCVYQPTQNCQQGYTYHDNDCRTPTYNCAYPKLDHPRQNNCITPNQCHGTGYTIQGTTCNYQQQQQNCQQGYTYHDNDCRTPTYNCAYPKLDHPRQNNCITPDQCHGTGYTIQGTTCEYDG